MQSTRGFSLVIMILYVIFFISLFCSFRAISSISIGTIIFAGIIMKKQGPSFKLNAQNLFLIACFLLFLLQFFYLSFSTDSQESWKNIRLKSGLFFTPLAVWLTPIDKLFRDKLLSWYCFLLAAASLYCLCMAFLHYLQSSDSSLFFYHDLVAPLKHHAVYFSALVFIALVFLWETIRKQAVIFRKPIHISLIIFFSLFLFLLSSKLVIIVYLLYLLYSFFMQVKKKTIPAIGSLILFIAITVSSLTLPNPVNERFNDIINKDLSIIHQEKFNPGNYFNGLQFRLLLWKFVPEILTKHQGWMTGVGPAKAQNLLDQTYTSKNMYIGEPARGDHGFLGSNTHNQFLESLLQTGVIGLSILLVICISLIWMAWRYKSRMHSFITLLLFLWLFTESVFETQYGVIIFTFFPLFLCHDEK